MKRALTGSLALLFALTISPEIEAGKPQARSRRVAQVEARARLQASAERELELTATAGDLERGRIALERERESLSWAATLLERRSREGLVEYDLHRGDRQGRQRVAEVRARKLYKLSRGGILEQVFERSGERSTPADRLNHARSLRFLIDHDLEHLRSHASAEAQARAELLAATRELSALAALEGVAGMQSHALAAGDDELRPTLASVHGERTGLQKQLRGRAGKRATRLLRNLASERRELERRKGLDLLEPGALARPVRGRIVGGFGDHRDPILDIPMHRNGIELGARPNDSVVAIAPGRVAFVGALPGFERVVVIEHGGGYLSLTARLLSVAVEDGQEVEGGALLGRVGAKAVDDGLGTTVYLELRHGQRPIDPQPWLESDRSRRRR